VKKIVLCIISNETAPYFVIRNAFQNHFHLCYDFDWVSIASNVGVETMQREFVQMLKAHSPDYCFMQLQRPGIMDVAVLQESAKYTRIINWTGDVRNHPGWYDWMATIGREIHLTLFSNETDVEILRRLGVKADYLQVGFDNHYYRRHLRINGWPEIVFVGNHYDMFDLSAYRTNTVLAMQNAFPGRFRVFGSGWENVGICTEPLGHTMEAECYNSCKLALSVSSFHYERYYSDRLLRIMACGCCPISHAYPGLEKDFRPGYDIVKFTDPTDLINQCRYYLQNDGERKAIGVNAHQTAHSKCTWDIRCKELSSLLSLYE